MIAIIGCSKNKKNKKCAAEEMYSESTLFKKALSYCSKLGYDKVFILSAKYGLLSPEEEIEPYDETLSKFTKEQKSEWGKMVFLQIQKKSLENEIFDFYAGRNYIEPLSDYLKINNPMKGLGIGQRLRYLS